jgi:preprotein translocase subunit SecG
MFLLFTILILIVCVFLILIVLVQNSKGGGLSSNFTSSNQVMGVRRTTDFLEKATWTLASALLVFSILASMTIPRGEEQQKSRIEDKAKNTVGTESVPNFPTAAPEPENEGVVPEE